MHCRFIILKYFFRSCFRKLLIYYSGIVCWTKETLCSFFLTKKTKLHISNVKIHFNKKLTGYTGLLITLAKLQFNTSKTIRWNFSLGFRNNTIVHYAAKGNQLDLVDQILNEGCDGSYSNDLGETPLHLLATNYHFNNNHGIGVAKRLMEGGADVNARTLWGDTPAHYAGRWSSHHLLSFFLDEGSHVDKNKGTVKPQLNKLTLILNLTIVSRTLFG